VIVSCSVENLPVRCLLGRASLPASRKVVVFAPSRLGRSLALPVSNRAIMSCYFPYFQQQPAAAVVLTLGLVLFTSASPSAAMEGIPVWGSEKKKVERVWNDAMMQGGREEAVRRVLALAADPDADIYAREYAVTKLADVGATEVTDEIKALVDSLSWINDSERTLANYSTAAYHRLKYLREPDPAKKHEMLLDSMENAKGAASGWAIDELIRTNQRRAMPAIARRLRRGYSGKYGESCVRLVEKKFEVMAAGENLPATLEQVAEGKFAGLEGLSSNERGRMQSWARRELRLLQERGMGPRAPTASPSPADKDAGARPRTALLVVVAGVLLAALAALAALIFRRRSTGSRP